MLWARRGVRYAVSDSIQVTKSGGEVCGVGVDLAIASSVLGCIFHVERVLGYGSPGIVYARLAAVGEGN